jgi:Na+/H+-translocating membrane pyrophosphatase
MINRTAAIVFRLVFAAASIVAMAVQLFAVQIPKGYSVVNFFSYFTNLSNILISVVFIVTAVRLIGRRANPTQADTAVRGAAVVYIVFVGLSSTRCCETWISGICFRGSMRSCISRSRSPASSTGSCGRPRIDSRSA